ncbi:MAG: hypothetical protein IKR94_02755 [Bacteroidales bacterium]|nr:hypothetical protein [Bacteroidales bacterium]MBR4214216.1 hypothetical protein [Bacteroidales bacterium]
MKKLLYIIVFSVLVPLITTAQTIDSQLLENCKKELADISAKKVDIHDIAFNSDGHWLILYGDIGYSYSYIPSSLENMLGKLNSAGTSIDKALLLSDSSFVLVYGGKQYTAQSLPTDFATELEAVSKKDKNIKSVAYKNGTRLMVFGSNGFIARGLPQKMVAKLAQLNKKKAPIRESAFYGTDGWVLLYGRTGMAFQGIPDDLCSVLQKFAKKGTVVNLVRFYGDKWVVVYDGYKVETNI